MTARRVSLTLTFATRIEADHLMRQVLNHLPDEASAVMESASVHEFQIDEVEPDEPTVSLVVADRVITGVYTDDPDRADDHARNVGGVVVELAIATDHRREVTA